MTEFFTTIFVFLASLFGGGEQPTLEPQLGAFGDPFLSLQVGTSPTSGDCLQTNGTDSTWDPCPAGSGGTGSNWNFTSLQDAITPSTTKGIIVNASSSISRLSSILSTSTSATSTNLHVSSLFSFNSVIGNSWDDFCVAITGGSGLCDGNDASGAGGTGSNWAFTAAQDAITPTTTVGIITNASSSISRLSSILSTSTNATSTNLHTNFLDIQGWRVSTSTTVCAVGCEYTDIQTAITDNKNDILLKNETYTLSAPLTIPRNSVTIRGVGRGSQINFDASTIPYAFGSSNYSSTRSFVRLKDVLFNQTGAAGTGTCLDISTFLFLRIDGVDCAGTNIGIMASTTSTHYNEIANTIMNVSGASSTAYHFTNNANDNVLTNTRAITSTAAIGYYFHNVHAINGTKLNTETNALYGLFIGSTANDLDLDVYLEGNQENVFIQAGAETINITGFIADADDTTNGNIIGEEGCLGCFINARVQYDAKNQLWGNEFSIGTTSPGALLGVHAQNGATFSNLFMIGSSTAVATTTLFSISNTGTITASSLTAANCDVKSSTAGVLSCGTDATGAGGTGSNWAFTAAQDAIAPTTTVGTIVSASSTFTQKLNMAFASSTLFSSITTQDAASVEAATFGASSATPADNDEVFANFQLKSTEGNLFNAAQIRGIGSDIDEGTSVDGRLAFAVMAAGTLSSELTISSTSIFPSTDAGNDLGGTANAFNNLHLDTGAVINFENGLVTLTHYPTLDAISVEAGALGVGTSSPHRPLTVSGSTEAQLALTDGSATAAPWNFRSAGSNLYVATSSPTTFATSTATALTILGASNNVGVATTSPMDALSIVGTSTFVGNTAHFGKTFCGTGGLYQYGLQGLEVCGDDNTTGGGVQILVDNNNAGANAWGGLTVNNNLADNTLTHFFGMFYNSSAYTDTAFGTFIGQKNLGLIQNTDGLLALISSTSSEALNPAGISFVTGGTATANERARIVPGGFIGLGTTTPKFATVNIASSTAPQLLLSPGGGVLSWTARSIGGMLYFSTTTTAGTATSSGPAAITIDGNSGTQGLYVATGTQATASGSIFETNGFVFMHGLTQATGGTNNDLCISGTPNQLIEETTGVCVVSMRDSKHDILDLSAGLDTLLNLRPVSYSPNQDEESDYNDILYGFVAEELAEADPHLARYGIDGKPRTIDDWGILSLVVKSVQELLAKVTGLEERMDAQEAQIEALEARLEAAGI